MALLDQQDPVVLLSNKFIDLLVHEDSVTSIAACASTLAILLDDQLRHGATPPNIRALRESLLELVVSAVRALELTQRES